MAVCHCCVSLQLGILKFLFCIIVLFTLYFVFYFVFCNGRLALPLLCTGLNLFIGLTVGHYMQWGQLTVGCHHMQQWWARVGARQQAATICSGWPSTVLGRQVTVSHSGYNRPLQLDHWDTKGPIRFNKVWKATLYNLCILCRSLFKGRRPIFVALHHQLCASVPLEDGNDL